MATKRPLPFVLAATNHGSMILNRNDYRMTDANSGYGVGFQLLNTSSFDPEEINFAIALLTLRQKYFGKGVVAIDGGANIGVHTIEWAKHMYGWGVVHAFEAQEKIYYALAGNIAINNCLNASAHLAALGAQCGELKIPVPNYLIPASFGSLELKPSKVNEFIGQEINYSESAMQSVALKSIDSFNWQRVDLIKIDVEGMELEVLHGAQNTIARARPIMMIEVIKSDKKQLEEALNLQNYRCFPLGINLLALHESDPAIAHIKATETGLNLTI
jgi:FkbM family methyltransferase